MKYILLNPLRYRDSELHADCAGCVTTGGFLISLFTFDSHADHNLWFKPKNQKPIYKSLIYKTPTF